MFKHNWEKTSVALMAPETINKMITLAFPGKALALYEVIKGGCANINIKICFQNSSKPLILRIYIRDKDACYREQKLALLLKETIPVPISHYIGEVDGYRYAIVDYMSGITLRDFLLEEASSNNISAIMNEVGTVLSQISSFEFSEAGFLDNNLKIIPQSTNNASLIAHAKECLASPNIKLTLELKALKRIDDCLKKYESLFPDPNEKHLVHGDFDPANILVTSIDGHWKITGILDWEFAFSGSSLWDVANMLRYSHKVRQEFQEGFVRALASSGMQLPKNWQITIQLLNILSLLDCLKRSNVHHKPNQCADICELITHFLSVLEL